MNRSPFDFAAAPPRPLAVPPGRLGGLLHVSPDPRGGDGDRLRRGHVRARLAHHFRTLVLPDCRLDQRRHGRQPAALGHVSRTWASDDRANPGDRRHRPVRCRVANGHAEVDALDGLRRGARRRLARDPGRAARAGRRAALGPRPRLHGAAVFRPLGGDGFRDFAGVAGRGRAASIRRRGAAAPLPLGNLYGDLRRNRPRDPVASPLLRRRRELVSIGRLGQGSRRRGDRGPADVVVDSHASRRAGRPGRLSPARLLAARFAVQIALACGTWITHYGWPEWFTRCFGDVRYTVVETGRWQIALTTLHVGAGSLCLALAVSTTLWSHRLLRDLPP